MGDKEEMTGEDIITLLNVWYERADYLNYRTDTRQALHFIMLINGLVGARPGSLFDFTYEDFGVFLQRDPDNPDVTFLIATIHLHHSSSIPSTNTTKLSPPSDQRTLQPNSTPQKKMASQQNHQQQASP